MNTAIKTKSGNISAYGFSCGYVEKQESDNGLLSKRLYMEHGLYTVERYYFGGTQWESFYTLSEARNAYKSINI